MLKRFTQVIFVLSFSFNSYAIQWDNVDMNGYFSFEYENQQSKLGNGDSNESFDLDLIDLVFNLKTAEKTRVSMDVTWEHGAATEDSQGNVAVEYAFIEHTISNKLKFKAGKFLIPFGIYNQIHTSKPAFLSVKESYATNKPSKILGSGNVNRFFPRWGTGLGASGHYDLVNDLNFDYDFLFTNGANATANEFEEDDNKSKALTTRFKFNLGTEYEIGLSTYNDANLVNDLNSQSIHFISHISHLRFETEYITGKNTVVATNITKDQTGMSFQLSYDFANINLISYFRYETIEPDKDVDNDMGYLKIIGINYLIDDSATFKFEYDIFTGESASPGLNSLPGNEYAEVKAALVVGF